MISKGTRFKIICGLEAGAEYEVISEPYIDKVLISCDEVVKCRCIKESDDLYGSNFGEICIYVADDIETNICYKLIKDAEIKNEIKKN